MLASDRSIQLCLTRVEEGEYWPRLLETKTKVGNTYLVLYFCGNWQFNRPYQHFAS